MKHLIDKYRSGDISPEELDILSDMVSKTSDEELSDILHEDWYAFSSDKQRRTVRLSGFFLKKHLSGIAAGIMLVISAGLALSLAGLRSEQKQMAVRLVTVSSEGAGQSTVTLPDGSKVILNTRSTITYPSDFGLDSREVELSGEGYFDVAKDPDKKFIVNAPGMEITVHGTKFNVYAYPDADMSEMSLVEGSVSLRSGESVIDVEPNEKVCVTRNTGRMNLIKTDNEIETLWLHDRIVFINDPLYKVFDVLQRCFGVQIECSDNVNLSDRYTATFKDKRISDILEVIKMHYGFSYEHDGHIIRIDR